MAEAQASSTTRTTCPYCGVGCGVLADVEDAQQRRISVRGDPEHPANYGRLCSKGVALGETVHLEGRLLSPEIGERQASWEEALDYVADGLARIRDQYGPEAIAVYASGQLLTEDYYVANKLVKGALGTANIDTNSRLCMASTVVGQKRAFGADAVPISYEDLENAELIVLVGSNTAWCHPVIFQRIQAAREANPNLRLVVIDPRRTVTAESADLHLPLKPGTDVQLFNGLLSHLTQHGALDFAFLEKHTEGFGEALATAQRDAPTAVAAAEACGLNPEKVRTFYHWFSSQPKALTLFSQGVNQSSSGTDKVNAITNVHLATGRIGGPGMGPFSLTGQPNAMGGREVGGLANQLAAHLDMNSAEHRERLARFWGFERVASEPGLQAVDLFNAVDEGRIKAVWIMATNPVVSLPDAETVKRALSHCELVVVSDAIADTDTARLAHVRLPAQTWAEKDGTVTNSERRISRQRRFLSPPGEAQPDWWVMTQVAHRLGHTEQFPYDTPQAIFDEHARLSGFERSASDAGRAFDISGLAGMGAARYDALTPIQWPVSDGAGTGRLFEEGGFYTGSRKARLVSVTTRAPAHATSSDYPLVLNTGRVRDQWHTMTRTGLSARLSEHKGEPELALHPADAAAARIEADSVVRVTSPWGVALLRAHVSDAQVKGQVFAPMHWTGENAAMARIGALVNPATDPHSGQPESKHTPVRVTPEPVQWYGFILSRRRLALECSYWVRIRGTSFYRYELAGRDKAADWPQWARGLLCESEPEGTEWIDYLDSTGSRYRGARLVHSALESCVFLGPHPDLPDRHWLGGLFAKPAIDAGERRDLLAGRPADPSLDEGRSVCACFGVGETTLRAAIRDQGLDSVAAIGEALQAGTNCGSCIPELKELLG